MSLFSKSRPASLKLLISPLSKDVCLTSRVPVGTLIQAFLKKGALRMLSPLPSLLLRFVGEESPLTLLKRMVVDLASALVAPQFSQDV